MQFSSQLLIVETLEIEINQNDIETVSLTVKKILFDMEATIVDALLHPKDPEEEKPNLPKSCYFNDGKTKVDYVLVCAQFEQVRGERTLREINQFVSKIKEKGLLVEREIGKVKKHKQTKITQNSFIILCILSKFMDLIKCY